MLFDEHRPALEFFLKLGGLIVAVTTLFFIYLQMGTIREQTEELKTQNEAIWYSSRPYLRIDNFEGKDLRKYSGSPVIFGELMMDSSSAATLDVKLRNVGSTGALLDTVYFQTVLDGHVYDTLFAPNGVEIAPTDFKKIVDFSIVPRKAVSNLKVEVKYRWDVPEEFSKDFRIATYVQFRSQPDGGWKIVYIPIKDYEEALEKQLDRLKN